MGVGWGRRSGGGWAPAEWWHRESQLTNVPITGSSVKKMGNTWNGKSLKKDRTGVKMQKDSNYYFDFFLSHCSKYSPVSQFKLLSNLSQTFLWGKSLYFLDLIVRQSRLRLEPSFFFFQGIIVEQERAPICLVQGPQQRDSGGIPSPHCVKTPPPSSTSSTPSTFSTSELPFTSHALLTSQDPFSLPLFEQVHHCLPICQDQTCFVFSSVFTSPHSSQLIFWPIFIFQPALDLWAVSLSTTFRSRFQCEWKENFSTFASESSYQV